MYRSSSSSFDLSYDMYVSSLLVQRSFFSSLFLFSSIFVNNFVFKQQHNDSSSNKHITVNSIYIWYSFQQLIIISIIFLNERVSSVIEVVRWDRRPIKGNFLFRISKCTLVRETYFVCFFIPCFRSPQSEHRRLSVGFNREGGIVHMLRDRALA